MKLLPILIAFLSIILSLGAPTGALADYQQRIISAIQNSEDTKDLDYNLERAEEEGASPQQVGEARVIWALVRGNYEDAKGYFDTVSGLSENWNQAEGLIIKKDRHLTAIGHLISARIADGAEDKEKAKAEILEAVWLAPDLDWILTGLNEIRPEDQYKISMDLTLTNADGTETTLAEHIDGMKALYIQVWATWCGPCIRLLPVLDYRNEVLPPQGIGVVALNSELGGEDTIGGNLTKAKEVREKTGSDVEWLIDPRNEESYAVAVEVDSVPRALIVDPEGNVIFNDHPASPNLVEALAKLEVELDTSKEAEILGEE